MNKKISDDIKDLLKELENTQWTWKTNFEKIKNLKIMTRKDLQSLPMKKGLFTTRTSGSTGEPVKVEKTYGDFLWYIASNIRELLWRKWDFSKNIAIIRGDFKKEEKSSWGIPKDIFPNQGKTYMMNFLPIKEIQQWLEEVNPHYIHCYPSIFKQLDITKISNFIDHKSTGEIGGTMFSSEECGTIAIQCPDNKENYHVLENQLIEVDDDGGMIISTLTNPYIRRYKNGDYIELGVCSCGRSLQTIKNIKGRVRNMFVLPNGDKKWPLVGSRDYYEKFGIKRFQAIQTSLHEIELKIICDPLAEKEKELIELVKKWIDSPVEVKINYVNNFPQGKFEEFVSMIT